MRAHFHVAPFVWVSTGGRRRSNNDGAGQGCAVLLALAAVISAFFWPLMVFVHHDVRTGTQHLTAAAWPVEGLWLGFILFLVIVVVRATRKAKAREAQKVGPPNARISEGPPAGPRDWTPKPSRDWSDVT